LIQEAIDKIKIQILADQKWLKSFVFYFLFTKIVSIYERVLLKIRINFQANEIILKVNKKELFHENYETIIINHILGTFSHHFDQVFKIY